jgi:nitrite reductase (NADH) small subunit
MVDLKGMALVRALGEMPSAPGELVEMRGAGGEPYAVCNVDGVMYAVAGACPHAGGPLGFGALHGHSIVCPWHAWEFDCRTGECDFNDSRVEVQGVLVRDGEVWLETGGDA